MQQQYFDKKNIALSFYCNIACENCSSDESLRASKDVLQKNSHSTKTTFATLLQQQIALLV